MSTYIFILGKDRDLSLAELNARYPDAKIQHSGDDFAILDMDMKVDQSELNALGGIVKIGSLDSKSDKAKLNESLVKVLSNGHESGKLNYGVSLYGMSENSLRPLLLDLKKLFKKKEMSTRFANQDFKNLTVAQHKGLGKGLEVLVAKVGSEFYIATVVATQDIDAYSKRDYYKPHRDMKMGMLPPKLAQIMINLTESDGTIWDPFCGGGTLVMEGLLMGHDMLGSDIAERNLSGAVKNMDWLQQEFSFKNRVDLFLHDATRPLMGKNFDAIACEGYLGPPQTRPLTKGQVDNLINELSGLYTGFFSALKEISFTGPVVIAMPFFRGADGSEYFMEEVEKAIEKIGFHEGAERLKYARKDQVVGRAIYRYELTS